MFRTLPEYEFKMPLPAALFGDQSGTQHWLAFEILFHDFWFIGEFLLGAESAGADDKPPRWHTFAADKVSDLIVLASEPQTREHRINLVIPTYHHKDGQLRLAPITEIFRGMDPDRQQNVTVYVTNDGARYVSSSLELQASDVVDKSLIYSKRDVDVRPNVPHGACD